jgi:hypothetical protein
MAFSQEQYQLIANALQSKANRFCPACGVRSWAIQTEGLVSLQIQTYRTQPVVKMPWTPPAPPGTPPQFVPIIGPGGPMLPCIVVVCTNCGLTQLHNVFTLGVAAALGIPAGGK